MEYVKSFRDLEVYKLSRKLSKEIFEASKTFPKEEMYSLTDQARRSSRSIGAQIAEAWGKRKYEKHFISKLTDADGEQLETQHWIETALDCTYISIETSNGLVKQCLSIGKMLGSMMKKSSSFCGDFVIPEDGLPITDN
jgi:four helix bundle protein